MLHTRLTFYQLLKRCAVIMPIVGLLMFATVIGVHWVNTYCYDVGFSKVELGDDRDRILNLLGPPDETRPPSLKIGVTEYVFRTYPPFVRKDITVRKQWRIVVDRKNHVVAKFRDDNGC